MVMFRTSKVQKITATLLLLIHSLSITLPVFAGGLNPTYVIRDFPPGVSSLKNKEIKKAASMVRESRQKQANPDEKVFHAAKRKNFISGPSQPEMNSFQSVGTDNMVNLFTGDFSYNIPLMDVGGYPVNLFYNAGITMDQEASWVGLGWNVNVGSITREVRGLPDDFAGGNDNVTKKQEIRKNLIVGASIARSGELVGAPTTFSKTLQAGINYSNYRGIGVDMQVNNGFAFSKVHSSNSTEKIGLNYAIGVSSRGNASMTLTPSFSMLVEDNEKNSRTGSLSANLGFNSQAGLESFQLDYNRSKLSETARGSRNRNLSAGFALSFSRPSYTPTIRMPWTTLAAEFSYKYGEEFTPYLMSLKIDAFFNASYLARKDQTRKLNAFGYLHLQDAVNDKRALLDFNRLNDGTYIDNVTPAISIPQYTFDVFNISGEGTGGTFRAYRNDIGYVRDSYVKTNTVNNSVGVEIGATSDVKAGVNLQILSSHAEVGEWSGDNLAAADLQFKQAAGETEPVYFRNPAEKGMADQQSYQSIADDKLIRVELLGDGSAKEPVTPTGTNFVAYKNKTLSTDIYPVTDAVKYNINTAVTNRLAQREKRTQVISYLTAEQADKVGLDKKIISYDPPDLTTMLSCNSRFTTINRFGKSGDPEQYRQPNHISEIDITQQDGKRYVYGLPVYNITRSDVTVAVNSGDRISTDPDIAKYVSASSADESKDKYSSTETISAYAHSFLLTGILSPDYSDVTGNGISDDDIGTAVKFNYSRYTKKPGGWFNFKWRTPVAKSPSNVGLYSEGLRTDNSDDKVSYSFGEKELWYLQSVESKTMVAYFFLKDGSRKDASGFNENGSRNLECQLNMLDRIELYAKSDLVKNGSNARPIKTAHFIYDYSLCANTPENVSVENAGRLTLKKVFFTYNKTNGQTQSDEEATKTKGYKNRYEFRYNEGVNNEFAYNRSNHDRWGTFKKASDNPGQLSNNDYPYSLQAGDNTAPAYQALKDKIDKYAGAWNLSEIDLPSGSTMKVAYESDDYAYVQNKRACEMMQIVGFGASNSGYEQRFYTFESPVNFVPYNYAFLKVPVAIPVNADESVNANAVYEKYLSGIRQLLMKLYVKVPKDNYTPAGTPSYEYINVYAEIKEWGLYHSNSDQPSDIIWIKMKDIDESMGGGLGRVSPVVASVFQFLKDRLPSKVYPGSDTRNDMPVLAMVKSLTAAIGSISYFLGENKVLATGRLGISFDATRSFGRLNVPQGVKIGGGYRVKKITVNDNWDRLSGEQSSEYGQEYKYTTSRKRPDGGTDDISSGVASYEPGFGSEENPFRESLNYSQVHFMGPTQFGAVELPLAESYYPSAVVGYSKVKVHSVNVTKNEKRVKGDPGVHETEFYTTKDFPTLTDYSLLDKPSKRSFNPQILNSFLKFYSVKSVTLSQGFRVQVNDMNGKIKSQSVYPEFSPETPISFTKYHYKSHSYSDESFVLDNNADVVKDPSGEIASDAVIGKDIEVMVDFQEHKTQSHSIQLQFNLDVKFPYLILPSFFVPYSFAQDTYRSTSTLKVVSSFGILDNVEVFNKGSNVTTENLVYDGKTGDVLVSASNNLFDKKVYSVNYPAWWAYKGMGPSYENIGVVYKNVRIRNGFIESPSVNQSLLMNGDEIYIKNKSSRHFIFFPSAVQLMPANGLCPDNCQPLRQSTEFKGWVVDISEAQNQTGHDKLIVDRYGVPFNVENAEIQVIRSGRRNMLTASAGTLTCLEYPVQTINGVSRLFISNSQKVISAAAISYKDRWKNEDGFFTDKTTIQTDHFYPLVTKNIPIVKTVNGTFYNTQGYNFFHSSSINFLTEINTNYFGARHLSYYDRSSDFGSDWVHVSGKHTFRVTRSWVQLKLDDTQLPVSAVIQSAKLNLQADDEQRVQTLLKSNGSSLAEAIYPAGSPHRNYVGGSNLFLIEPLKSTWTPSANADTRLNLFESDALVDKANTTASFPATTPIFSSSSYLGTDAIDITRSIQSLQAGRLSGYQPAFRMRIISPVNSSQFEKRQFFKVNDQELIPGGPSNCVPYRVVITPNPGITQIPAVKIIYKDCSTGQYQIKTAQNGATTEVCAVQNTIYASTVDGSSSVTISVSPNDEGTCTPGNPPIVVSTPVSFVRISYYDKNTECGNGVSCTGETVNVPTFSQGWGCRSVHEKDYINPFVYGFLGNWRPLKSYTYYGDRSQNDLSQRPDLATDGSIKDFVPYWTFNSSGLIATSNEFNWKWTAEVTKFNRKGLELESHDPLQRYTSAQYGYNESMPVAIASNAKYAEMGYEGFEDFGFSDELCATLCKPNRHLIFNGVTANSSFLSATEKHTGTTSLKLTSGQTVELSASVKGDANEAPELNIPVSRPTINVVPAGTGLTANYLKKNSTNQYITIENSYPSMTIAQKRNCLIPGVFCSTKTDESVTNGLPKEVELTHAEVNWKGWLQIDKSGNYLIRVPQHDDYAMLQIKDHQTGVLVFNQVYNSSSNAPISVNLAAGTIYEIYATYKNYGKQGSFLIEWKGPCDPAYVNIPTRFLYNYGSMPGVSNVPVNPCLPATIKMEKALLEGFSAKPGTKYNFSIWVKETGPGCGTQSFQNNRVEISFTNNGTATGSAKTLHATGVIIDGWQRFDDWFVVPGNADKISVRLIASGSADVYFDDMRMHPYEANMKSFVYDKNSLRLKAELDENNYASFYDYDDDGTLVRVRKETTNGVKTIQESRSSTFKRN